MNRKDTKAQRITRLNVSTLGLESGENHFDRMTRDIQPQIARISTDFHLFFLIFRDYLWQEQKTPVSRLGDEIGPTSRLSRLPHFVCFVSLCLGGKGRRE